MKKLELKDIAGNIPYDLHVITDRTDGNHLVYCVRKEQLHIIGFESGINIEFCKAIMRPLSDLYKTITHNGKEIIPIVECAKIARSGQNNYRLERDYCDITVKRRTPNYRFVYDKDANSFRLIYTGNFTDCLVPNQWKLFDYFHELKIDYRGLIESGSAIDCNTLENNPYK